MISPKRRSLIVRYLASNDRIDIAHLSEQLGVSPQTLKLELAAIEREVGEGLCLREVSPNLIEVTDRSRFALLQNDRAGERQVSTEESLMLVLLLSRSYLTLQALADAVFLSRSSVEKHVARLSRHGSLIETTRRRGIRFAGSEARRRSVLVKILLPFVIDENRVECLSELPVGRETALDVLGPENVEKADRFVRAVSSGEGAVYTDDSLAELFCNVAVTLWAVDGGAEPPNRHIPEPLVSQDSYEQCSEQVASLDVELGLDLPEAEKHQLVTTMLSLRKSEVDDMGAVLEKMGPLVDHVLGEIRTSYQIDLSHDATLRKGLALHLWTTVIRHESLASSPVLYSEEELRRTYPLGFELAAVAARVIEEEYDYLPSKTEITYITLHLQAALERAGNGVRPEREVRAIIVCHYGLAASNLIAERVEQALPQLHVVGSFSLGDYRSHVSDCDLIISTEPLQDATRPVFYVTPMLHGPEMAPLRSFVQNRHYLNKAIEELVRDADIVDLSGCPTVEDAVRALSEPLEQRGDVSEGFAQSVLDRERIAPTNLDGIAIPHGNPSLVERTRLVIGRAPEGIAWDDTTVYLVFLLAFSGASLRDNSSPFSTFYRRLAKPGYAADLVRASERSGAEFRYRAMWIIADEERR